MEWKKCAVVVIVVIVVVNIIVIVVVDIVVIVVFNVAHMRLMSNNTEEISTCQNASNGTEVMGHNCGLSSSRF